jgi:deoxyadenosine/deoxycytidine kinase
MKITVGGNIGCGKTTLIRTLDPKWNVKPEPIEKWGSWLDLFYSDMKRFCFSFQMKILYDFLGYDNDAFFVSERSPMDSLYVFAKGLVHSDIMSYMEYNLLSEFVHHIGWVPDVYIYLRTSPEICFERIQQRSRDCENGVGLDYIKTIHQEYERLTSQILVDMNVKVHVIDASKSPSEVKGAVENIIYTYTKND